VIAIEGELTNERVDLAQGQRHGRTAFDVLPQEAIGRHADLQRGFGRLVDDGRSVLLGQPSPLARIDPGLLARIGPTCKLNYPG
jgi:hypothetical protein